MIHPIKQPIKPSRPDFEREAPPRLTDPRNWRDRAGGLPHAQVPDLKPAPDPFAAFRPRWWRGEQIPL
ncbi:MAG: hypothetical protein WD294_10280 [Phycisphaeraceae bacterium]